MIIDELMNAGYRIISNNTFYEIEKDYFQFDVKKDTTSSIVLSKNDLLVKFGYEPIYENYRQTQIIPAMLTFEDITLGERSGLIQVRAGKGNKARSVPLNASAREAIATYVASRLRVEQPSLKKVVARWPKSKLTPIQGSRFCTCRSHSSGLLARLSLFASFTIFATSLRNSWEKPFHPGIYTL